MCGCYARSPRWRRVNRRRHQDAARTATAILSSRPRPRPLSCSPSLSAIPPGYVRVALPGSECERLNLPPMCHRDTPRSASRSTFAGRAQESRRPIAPAPSRHWHPSGSRASDFRRPGHVVPLQADADGVLGPAAGRPRRRSTWPVWPASDAVGGALRDRLPRRNPTLMAHGDRVDRIRRRTRAGRGLHRGARRVSAAYRATGGPADRDRSCRPGPATRA